MSSKQHSRLEGSQHSNNRMSRKLGIFENVTIIVAMVLLDLFVAAPATTAAARKCPAGQFLPPDSLLNECRRCSSCPDNEIIRKPCSEERDTECGPFYEFRDFNSFQPGEAELDIGVGQYPKNRATGSPELEDFKNEFSEDSTSESKDGISAKGQKGKSFIIYFLSGCASGSNLHNCFKLLAAKAA